MPNGNTPEIFAAGLIAVTDHIQHRFSVLNDSKPIPSRREIDAALQALPSTLPQSGLGVDATVHHLIKDITLGLLRGHAGSRFYGLVTGGVTPASQLADILGTSYDESLQINFPDATMAVALEQRALDMVLDLLDIPTEWFEGRTVTTGATASNIMGLACGRDFLLQQSPHLPDGYNIAEHGFPPHITMAGQSPPSVPAIKVLTVKAHGSILKAAAITGIGRANVLDIPAALSEKNPWGLAFDTVRLEEELCDAESVGQGVIVVVTLGEVNTGGFTPNISDIEALCRQYHAWLHIDGAFGGFGALLPQYRHLVEEMKLADSLTLDAHKWLNVPYDTAMFYTRKASDLTRSFGPSPRLGTPAYLQVHADSGTAPEDVSDDVLKLRKWLSGLTSPLNCGIENSRRFRALPLYAGLLEQGKAGYTDIVRRNCDFAQRICAWLTDPTKGGKWYTVVNIVENAAKPPNGVPLNIVMFRGSRASCYPPSDPSSTTRLLHAINRQRLIYVTPTSWAGVGALRIAVSNWRTGLEGNGDFEAVITALSGAAQGQDLES